MDTFTLKHWNISPEDWEAKGYKRFSNTHHLLGDYCSFGLQKLVSDEIGKKYYITVKVYDNSDLVERGQNISSWSYSPSLQFISEGVTFDFDPFFHDTTIEGMEKFIQGVWDKLDCDYYETWDV